MYLALTLQNIINSSGVILKSCLSLFPLFEAAYSNEEGDVRFLITAVLGSHI